LEYGKLGCKLLTHRKSGIKINFFMIIFLKKNLYKITMVVLFFNGAVSSSLYSSPDDIVKIKAYQIFGFHPYWMKESYKSYDYSTLTVVTYLSYEVNPASGNYKDLHQWAETKIVETAKSKNPSCKVLLGVTNFGEENNSLFLNNPKAKTLLIKNLVNYVKLKKADGVTIDFEKILPKDKNVFSDFIEELKTAFKNEDKNLIIALTLPAFDREDSFDEKELSKYIDWFAVMSYENDSKKTVRALAPLKGKWGITSSVDQYTKAGIPYNKLILTVAYYGIVWNSDNNRITGNLKYNEIKSRFAASPEFDTLTSSVFYSYKKDGQNYQCWFEDSMSLGYKYDYIKEQKLGGVGIFALGYDKGRAELWDLLRWKFLATEVSDSNNKFVLDSMEILQSIIRLDQGKAESLNKLILTGLIVIFLLLVGIIFLRKSR
jgi:spore germination protein